DDGIRNRNVTGVQTCALPISSKPSALAISMAVSTIVAASRFGLGPREAGDRRPHSALSPGGRTTSAMDLLCMNDVAGDLALTVRSEERRVGKGVDLCVEQRAW